MVDNKNLEEDEIKDKIEEETLDEVKEEEQDLEDIKKVLEEALSAEEEANAADDASKDSKDAKIADLEDRLKRQIAEFDNFRKRTEKAIDCLDKEFDLNLHNAVMHVEDEAYGNNIIIEEFQKGYKYKDTVIRHSMVKVAN